ncbi:unnamed protein product [Effrenium voratum]|nr:unnamed protein product [Effrenium voratum]
MDNGFDVCSRVRKVLPEEFAASVILQQCQHCFSFLKSLSPAQRARCSLRYVAQCATGPRPATGHCAKAARRAGKQSDTCGPHPLATCVRSMVSRHILAELCKSRALRQACQLLETAKLGTGRPRSQAIGLNLVLSALSQEARWQEALHLLTTCQADVVSFTSVITACRARWQTALRLLERMGHQRIAADGVAQNAAGSACERASSWPRCIALASDGVGASVAVSACVRVRAWRPGLALLRRSAAVDSAAATPLLRAWRLGAELLSWLRHARVRPDALARERFGHACAEETCWQLALHLRTGLHGYPLAAWRSAAALAAGGSSPLFASKAMSLCAKARQWSLAVSLLGGRPVDTAMCAAAMSPESAEGLLQLLRQRGLRLGAAFCTALASARSSAGWRAAGSLLTRLEAWAVLPGTILWNVKMADCAWPRAAAVFERLPSASLSADEATWSGLAAACGKSGLWHLASQLLRQMRKLSLERSYVTAACAASCEDWRWALSAAGEATAPEAVLAALARSSRWSRALQVTSREGPLSAGHALNQICLNSLVFACGSAGRWQLATSLSPLDQVGASAAIGATNCPWQVSLQLLGLTTPDVVCFSAAISSCARAIRRFAERPYGGSPARPDAVKKSVCRPFPAQFLRALNGSNAPVQLWNSATTSSRFSPMDAHRDYLALVTAFYEDLWNKADDEALRRILAPEVQFKGSTECQVRCGPEAFRDYRNAIRSTLANYTCTTLVLEIMFLSTRRTILDVTFSTQSVSYSDVLGAFAVDATTPHCVARVKFSGRHVAAFHVPPLNAFEATGAELSWLGVAYFFFSGSQIRGVWVMGDVAAIYEQLSAK